MCLRLRSSRRCSRSALRGLALHPWFGVPIVVACASHRCAQTHPPPPLYKVGLELPCAQTKSRRRALWAGWRNCSSIRAELKAANYWRIRVTLNCNLSSTHTRLGRNQPTQSETERNTPTRPDRSQPTQRETGASQSQAKTAANATRNASLTKIKLKNGYCALIPAVLITRVHRSISDFTNAL